MTGVPELDAVEPIIAPQPWHYRATILPHTVLVECDLCRETIDVDRGLPFLWDAIVTAFTFHAERECAWRAVDTLAQPA